MIHKHAITLKQLRALHTIHREGNLTAAAAKLNLTTPAVSTQLRGLESNLDAILLRRGPDGIALPTAMGEQVLIAAAQIESALQLCVEKIEAHKSGRLGLVSLGVVSTGKYFSPDLVARAKQKLPGLRIDLKVGNRNQIIRALSNGGIDLAIMGRPPRSPDVEADELGDHPHVLICSHQHPFAQQTGKISADDVLNQTFLTRESGSGTRLLMERFLDQIGQGRVYESFEFGSNETIKQAVIADLGISIISAHTIMAELESGRLKTVSFPGLPLIRTWHLVRRASQELDPASASFRRFVLASPKTLLPDVTSHLHGKVPSHTADIS